MEISGVGNKYVGYTYDPSLKTKRTGNDFSECMSAASIKAEKQESGDVLGLTMLKDPGSNCFWGMKAKYAECSTQDNPVIYVETNYGGKTVSYNVNINEVDPGNASQLEIFALCSYADDVGIGDGSTFGTYSTLRSYKEMAVHNGYIHSQTQGPGGIAQFKNEKLNWVNMCENVVDLLYKCNDLVQYRKGLSILDLFSKHPVK